MRIFLYRWRASPAAPNSSSRSRHFSRLPAVRSAAVAKVEEYHTSSAEYTPPVSSFSPIIKKCAAPYLSSGSREKPMLRRPASINACVPAKVSPASTAASASAANRRRLRVRISSQQNMAMSTIRHCGFMKYDTQPSTMHTAYLTRRRARPDTGFAYR